MRKYDKNFERLQQDIQYCPDDWKQKTRWSKRGFLEHGKVFHTVFCQKRGQGADGKRYGNAGNQVFLFNFHKNLHFTFHDIPYLDNL